MKTLIKRARVFDRTADRLGPEGQIALRAI